MPGRGPRTFGDLPEDVQDHLSGMDGFRFAKAFATKHGLGEEGPSLVLGLVEQVVLRDKSAEDLPSALKELGVPADKAEAAAAELARMRLMPIANEVPGNIAGLITKWARASGEATPEILVKGILQDAGIDLGDQVYQHRLELLLVDFLEQKRDKDATVAFLQKGKKVGGLEMKEEDAKALVGMIEKQAASSTPGTPDKQSGPVRLLPRSAGLAPLVSSTGGPPPPATRLPQVANRLSPENATRPPEPKPVVAPVKVVVKNGKRAPGAAAVADIPAAPAKPKLKFPANPFEQDGPGLVMATPRQQSSDAKASSGLPSGAPRHATRPPVNLKFPANPFLPEKPAAKEPPKRKFELAKAPKVEMELKDSVGKANGDLQVEKQILDKAPQAARPAGPQAAGEKAGAKVDTFSEEDEKEVRDIAGKKEKVVNGTNGFGEYKDLVESIVNGCGVELPDAEARKRFAGIVETRVRDVRDPYEMRAALEVPTEKGGIGLTGTKLADCSEAIERLVGEYRATLDSSAKQDKKGAIDRKVAEMAKKYELNKQEKAMLAHRYIELTGRAPTELISPTAPTGARVSAAERIDDQMERLAKQIDAERVKAAVQAGTRKPPRAAVAMSASTVVPTGGRPQVTDVRPARRLAGPVEELGGMTLVEFRRLGKKPQLAADRVFAKIVQLEESEGYGKKLAAIEAWRSSPLSRAYLALSREALATGKTMDALAEEKAGAGEQVPSPEELHALVSLNAKLRF